MSAAAGAWSMFSAGSAKTSALRRCCGLVHAQAVKRRLLSVLRLVQEFVADAAHPLRVVQAVRHVDPHGPGARLEVVGKEAIRMSWKKQIFIDAPWWA